MHMRSRCLIAFSFLFISSMGWAHKGIPYPVLVDHPTSLGNLSVSSDPDVGEGIFLITLSAKESLPNLKVVLSARAKEGTEVIGPIEAARDNSLEQRGERLGFKADLPFSHEGQWQAEIVLSDESKGASEKVLVDVNVTLPGPTKAESLIYILPFLAVGILLLISRLRKKPHTT